MDSGQRPVEVSKKLDQSPSRDIEDFINEGISSIILSNPEFSLEHMKAYDKEVDTLKENSYLNSILRNEDAGKTGLTRLEDPSELKSNIDMFYLNSMGKNELDPTDFSYMKNLDSQLFFFGNNPENSEAPLSYHFSLMDRSSPDLVPGSMALVQEPNFANSVSSPYTNNGMFTCPDNILADCSEDKSEKNSRDFSKELSYGEHVICNKIETLQRMIKNMIMTMHEKYNGDSNLRYEPLLNELPTESIYDFTLAQMFCQKTQKRSSLKLLASHGVIGSFFGSNGHRVQALQQEFNVNVSVTTKRIHFPGSNNKGVLLINGKLYNILKVLRPLYRAIQEEVIRLLIDESVRVDPVKIRLEIEVLIPESLRFTMDRNKYFKQIMEMTGANIRVIKQTYEDGPVQERVLVLFGSQNEVELALEKVALMIQEDSGFKHYGYMNYPDLTVALNASEFTLRPYQKKGEAELNKCKKKYSS